MSKTVVVSGGFDPLHVGHLQMMLEARELGDELIVILNNDNWLRAKKGRVFMPEEERRFILNHIDCVDKVILSMHEPNTVDMSVCKELRAIDPHIFANGGDRFADNTPEKKLCEEMDIHAVFNVGGGKLASSSELVKKYEGDDIGKD